MVRDRKNSGTMASMESELELKGRILARKAAGEGMVLLKNEEHILPLKPGKKTALYGCGTSYSACCIAGGGELSLESGKIYSEE